MSADPAAEVDRILAATEEADDALREVVALLAGRPGIAWAGIAFVEEGRLVVGPAAGTPDESARTAVPVAFQGDRVGEVWVDGDGKGEEPLLRHVADAIATHVLIGWDTGGDAWEP